MSSNRPAYGHDQVLPHTPPTSRVQIVTDPHANGYQMAEWAINRLKDQELTTVNDLGPFRAFGIIRQEEDGIKPMAVVIFNWFRQLPHGNDMRVIIVSEDPRWCLPGILAELFSYPFETAGCERLTAVIKDGNERSLKLCRGLGFTKEGTLRRAYDGKTNAVMLGMLKQECRWLNRLKQNEQVHGKEEPFSSGAARSSKNNRRSNRRKQRSANGKRAA